MVFIDGHYLRVYVGATAVAAATECSYSLTTAMRETAHKDTAGVNGGFDSVRPGKKAGTMNTSALYSETGSFDALFDAWTNGTELDLRFSDEESGHKSLVTKGYITALDKNAPNNEDVTYSVSFRLSILPTRVVNA